MPEQRKHRPQIRNDNSHSENPQHPSSSHPHHTNYQPRNHTRDVRLRGHRRHRQRRVHRRARGAAGRTRLPDRLRGTARPRRDREPFRELIAALEQALDLTAHRPGSLTKLAPYLHERTAGRIGSLARLIRQAAIEAILDSSERITKTLLDTITLDHLAEEHYRPRTPGRRARPGSR